MRDVERSFMPVTRESLRALRRVVADWLTDQRITDLEDRMTSAEQTYTDSWERFDQTQREGFAALSARLAELSDLAREAGNVALQRAAARVDAARDSLAAGFAEFRVAPDTPATPADGLPPVINPDTPPVADIDPGATDGLPVDAAAVATDPAVTDVS